MDKMGLQTLFVRRIQQSTPLAAVTTLRASHIGPFILWYFFSFSLITLDTGPIRPFSLTIAMCGTKKFHQPTLRLDLWSKVPPTHTVWPEEPAKTPGVGSDVSWVPVQVSN